jgi:phage baseplate assembly protein W
MAKNINIKFPFKDSVKGFFLDMTNDDISAIKSDLMHLLLTNKGERYYLPDYGTNLKKHLFNPNDGITHSEIKEEISDAVKKYIPNLLITNLKVDYRSDNAYYADVRVDFLIQDGVFEKRDFIIIPF